MWPVRETGYTWHLRTHPWTQSPLVLIWLWFPAAKAGTVWWEGFAKSKISPGPLCQTLVGGRNVCAATGQAKQEAATTLPNLLLGLKFPTRKIYICTYSCTNMNPPSLRKGSTFVSPEPGWDFLKHLMKSGIREKLNREVNQNSTGGDYQEGRGAENKNRI